VHGLISLSADQTIKDTLRLIKGESSHWFNKTGFHTGKLYWQDDYYAVSVGNSGLTAVQTYLMGRWPITR
jgi:REP element-mobilizing transposase RayT